MSNHEYVMQTKEEYEYLYKYFTNNHEYVISNNECLIKVKRFRQLHDISHPRCTTVMQQCYQS